MDPNNKDPNNKVANMRILMLRCLIMDPNDNFPDNQDLNDKVHDNGS